MAVFGASGPNVVKQLGEYGQTKHEVVREMGSRENFRENLKRLAGRIDCDDASKLAKRLGWIRNKKKWLRRAWEHGIERPNSRTADDLAELAQLFGLEPQHFWISPETWIEWERSQEVGNREDIISPVKREQEEKLFAVLAVEMVYWRFVDMDMRLADELRQSPSMANEITRIVEDKIDNIAKALYAVWNTKRMGAWSSEMLDDINEMRK